MCMPVHMKYMKCFEDNYVMPWNTHLREKLCDYKHKIYACSFIYTYICVLLGGGVSAFSVVKSNMQNPCKTCLTGNKP